MGIGIFRAAADPDAAGAEAFPAGAGCGFAEMMRVYSLSRGGAGSAGGAG